MARSTATVHFTGGASCLWAALAWLLATNGCGGASTSASGNSVGSAGETASASVDTGGGGQADSGDEPAAGASPVSEGGRGGATGAQGASAAGAGAAGEAGAGGAAEGLGGASGGEGIAGEGGTGTTVGKGGAAGVVDPGGTGGSGVTVGQGGAAEGPAAGGAPGAIEPYLTSLVPFQHWHEQTTPTVGLLYVASEQDWGKAVTWTALIQTSALGEYWYSFDGSSPYVLYFPSTGEGVHYLVDWSVPVTNGEVEATYDAALFSPETPNPWGLENPAHLVRLGANDGKGATGLHFVATSVEVLDQTPDYPIDPTATLLEGRRRFDGFVLEQSDVLEALRARARADLGLPEGVITSEFTDLGLWPTWMNDTNRLRMTFILGVLERWLEQVPDCYPGLPDQPYQSCSIDRGYRVEQAMVLEADITGAIVSTVEHGPALVDPWLSGS